MEKIQNRQEAIGRCRRMVIKVGTRLLTDYSRIPAIVAQIARLREKDYRIMLVSSGAIGTGMQTLGMDQRPGKLSQVQALAAVGQSQLMSLYEQECRKLGFHAAQLLLTADDLRDRERHLNVLNCISALWAQGILPIINENDSVSVDEIVYGDNDILAALLATMSRSELTILLTTVDGMYERQGDKLGERISIISKISDDLRGMASDTDNSSFSIGGMASKLKAAEIITEAGEYLWIADGREADILERIVQGDDIGTLFVPQQKKPMQSRKRWLSFFSQSAGKITVDDGAINAICRQGRSLLPSGITAVTGEFQRGDTVEITDTARQTIARGLSNYSANEIKTIMGRKSREIISLLGHDGDEEVVHRNNLVLVDKT